MKVTSRTFLAVLAVCVGGITAFWIVYGWTAQSGAGATCGLVIDKATPGYVELRLKHQEPVEPGFSGELFYNVKAAPSSTKASIKVSGAQGYGDEVSSVNIVSQPGYWCPVGPVECDVEPLRGSHRRFPFDSATFAFTVTSDPPLKAGIVRIINRVDGFVLNCTTVTASSVGQGSIRIGFHLQRNPLVQLASIVLVVGCGSFAVLIIRSKTTEALAGAAASSFFSIWSIRSILSSQIHTFPTFFDLAILTMSITVLGAVLWRTLVRSITVELSSPNNREKHRL